MENLELFAHKKKTMIKRVWHFATRKLNNKARKLFDLHVPQKIVRWKPSQDTTKLEVSGANSVHFGVYLIGFFPATLTRDFCPSTLMQIPFSALFYFHTTTAILPYQSLSQIPCYLAYTIMTFHAS